jgi:hypothetical protein
VHLHFGVVVGAQRRVAAMARGAEVIRDRQFSKCELRERLLGSTARIERVWGRTRIVDVGSSLAARRYREAVRLEERGGRSAHAISSIASSAGRLAWRRLTEPPAAIRSRLASGNAMTAPAITALRATGQRRPVGARTPLHFRTKRAQLFAELEALIPTPRPRRPVRLVWRSAGSDSGRSSSAPTSRPLESVMPPPAPSPRAGATPVTAALEPQMRRLPVRTADFEPGVLDRLTDDVIRRVERRARIERERRGL